jgi:hypothetical protein
MTIQNTLTNVVLVVVAAVVVLVVAHGLGIKNAVTTTAAPLGQMFVVKRNTESIETTFSLDAANMVEICCFELL